MTFKEKLVMTTAIVGLAAGMGSGQALAFNQTHWQWNKVVDTNEYINKWVWGDFYPSGLAEVEKLQINIGDIYSEVRIKGDYAAETGVDGQDGTVTVDLGTVTVEADKNGAGQIIVTAVQSGGDVDLNPLSINNQSLTTAPPTATVDFGVDVLLGSIEVEVPGFQPASLDATTELAHVIGSATAVANFDSISSTVQTDVHTGQFNYGDQTEVGSNYDTGLSSGNEFHAFAANLINDIGSGYIQQGSVESKARAGSWWNPIDAAVQLDSFAAGNVEIVSLASNSDPSVILGPSGSGGPLVSGVAGSPTVWYPVATDQVLIADITQVNYANVTSTAKSYQDLTAFNNLGNYNGLGTSGLVAKLTSTAFGNFSQISVGGPAVP